MPTISLKAHYDGERIVLDEPCQIAPNSRLLVTVLADTDRRDWTDLAAHSLARAYGDEEPDYRS